MWPHHGTNELLPSVDRCAKVLRCLSNVAGAHGVERIAGAIRAPLAGIRLELLGPLGAEPALCERLQLLPHRWRP